MFPANGLESRLRDWLAVYLRAAGCRVSIEQAVGLDAGIADLVIERSDNTFGAVEVKATGDRRSLMTALGQAITYRAAGASRVGILIPRTPVIADAILVAFEDAEVQIVEADVTPGYYSALTPAFPYLWRDSSYPWGRVEHPHAHFLATPLQSPRGASST